MNKLNNSPESGFTLSLYAGEDDEEIGCCSSLTGRALEGSLRHPECLPIDISASDTFYGRFGQRCMEFARSLTAFGSGCRLGAREQVGTRHGGGLRSGKHSHSSKTCILSPIFAWHGNLRMFIVM